MKKILKLTLVLSIFAVLTISCSKIKTYGLVGTYKTDDGKFMMMVDQEGGVQIGLATDEDVTKLTATQRAFVKSLITYSYDSQDSLGSTRNSFTLEPWDLTEEKATQTFEVKVKKASGINFDSTNPYNSTANAFEEVTYKAEFTKDKETYTCKVTISIPDAVKNINNKYLPYGGGSGGGQNTPQDKSAGYQIDNGGEMTFKK